ncbi:MAG TPA: choice-of-anchor tandem repeat GloVer-containing protein, partial [Rhizomicrobium sp.]
MTASNAAEKTLYSFHGGSDGGNPEGALISDSSGNLYGTTYYGGNNTCFGETCGTVYKLAPDGTETVLYAFTGAADGGNPASTLVQDSSGNLFGTTKAYGPDDYGTIFEIGSGGSETTLYTFLDTNVGVGPVGNLVMDPSGNLFGVTFGGGKKPACCGVIYELQSNGTLNVLYEFKGRNDGNYPQNLTSDGAGNLYGVTLEGGGYSACVSQSQYCGTVFRYSAASGETVLHAFEGGNDGSNPAGMLVIDKAGNLIGTTQQGGNNGCNGYGCGTVFKISSDGTESILHAFHGSDGAYPYGGVIIDNAGNLYGTTNAGGRGCRHQGCGTVFKLAPDGTETTLANLNRHSGDG